MRSSISSQGVAASESMKREGWELRAEISGFSAFSAMEMAEGEDSQVSLVLYHSGGLVQQRSTFRSCSSQSKCSTAFTVS